MQLGVERRPIDRVGTATALFSYSYHQKATIKATVNPGLPIGARPKTCQERAVVYELFFAVERNPFGDITGRHSKSPDGAHIHCLP